MGVSNPLSYVFNIKFGSPLTFNKAAQINPLRIYLVCLNVTFMQSYDCETHRRYVFDGLASNLVHTTRKSHQ
jgi:hypothetical protein